MAKLKRLLKPATLLWQAESSRQSPFCEAQSNLLIVYVDDVQALRNSVASWGRWIGFGIIEWHYWIALIVDFCGLTDFGNTVDRVSAVIFDTGTVLCLSYVRILGPRQPLDHRSDLSSTLVGMSMSSSLFFFEISSFKLSCKTVIGIVLCYSHQACYHTSLLLNLYTSDSGCRCVFGFEQSDALPERRHGSADFHTPIHLLIHAHPQTVWS